MIALKLITFILIVRDTLCWDDPYFWLIESATTASAYTPELCPEGKISWTKNDIVDLIHYVETTLNIIDTANDVYYNHAAELRDKYVRKLEEFLTNFADRPNHVMHILEIIAEMREGLQPRVEDIAVKLQKFTAHEEQYDVIIERADKTFSLLDNYKTICQLNCGNSGVKTGLKIDETKKASSTLRKSGANTRYCFKIIDLHDAIEDKLSQYKEYHEETLRHLLEHGDAMYNEKLENLKSTLKNIAIVKFGTTMYDILSLQDDYYNLEKYVTNNNVSMELKKLKNNKLVIEHKLIDLEMGMEKYRKFCIDCNTSVLLIQPRQGITTTWRQYRLTTEFDILDDLIYSELFDNLNQYVVHDYTQMIEELEVKLQNPGVINSYVEDLTPIQREITYEIENEQYKLGTLKNKIPSGIIAEISELLLESKDLLDKIVSAKEYISQFI